MGFVARRLTGVSIRRDERAALRHDLIRSTPEDENARPWSAAAAKNGRISTTGKIARL
ncbi:MAG: hypothetical protein Q7J01_02180 [Syntrophales bacterium]|nr:hypothetical protein [Syntrophales bacterium]